MHIILPVLFYKTTTAIYSYKITKQFCYTNKIVVTPKYWLFASGRYIRIFATFMSLWNSYSQGRRMWNTVFVSI